MASTETYWLLKDITQLNLKKQHFTSEFLATETIEKLVKQCLFKTTIVYLLYFLLRKYKQKEVQEENVKTLLA